MFKRALATLLALFAITADATIIGGSDVGWQIDTGNIAAQDKTAFGWDESKIQTTGFEKFSNTYSVPGMEWRLSGKAVAMLPGKGPAFFSITEILNGSTLEDVKRLHYRVMSDAKGFKEAGCVLTELRAQSCEVLLDNWSPAKAFYAVFYQWTAAGRTFVLVVRNAQPSPDRSTPEQAMQALIPLIKAAK